MFISTWNQSLTGNQNLMNNYISNMLALGKTNANIDKAIRLFPVTNGMISDYSTLQYLRNKYGDAKPVCLLEKILREIKRVVKQVVKLVSKVVRVVIDKLKDLANVAISVVTKAVDAAIDVIRKAWNPISDIIGGGK